MSSDSEGFLPGNESGSEEEIEIQNENINVHHGQSQTQQSQTSGGSSTSTINFDCPSLLLKPFAIGPFNSKKPLQQFFRNDAQAKSTSSSTGGGKKVICNFCSTGFTGSYTRLDAHLSHKSGFGVRKCANINKFQLAEIIKLTHMGTKSDLKEQRNENPSSSHPTPSQPSPTTRPYASSSRYPASSSLPSATLPPSRKRGNIHDALNIQAKEIADDAVSLFFYAHGLPFHLARSPYFRDAFEKVREAGPSYVLPGETRLRSNLLEKQYAKCSLMMHTMKTSWVQNGCSIVMDGWTDIRQHPLINIIVTCPDGPFFLRAIDCSGKKKDSEFQFHLLRQAIEDVGPSNVVQVITDAAPVCKRAGKLVESTFRHIYWTPCCVHALNNALRDIGKIEWVKDIVQEARKMQMFICNHHTSMALFRCFSKKEFIKPAETRYATYYLLLERILELHQPLQSMVVSSEWKKWKESESDEGKTYRLKILNDSWWDEIRYMVSFIAPIHDVIRYGDTDSPNLGEIYETFDSMIERIKNIITAKDPSFFTNYILPIVMKRWNKMNTPMHMAAHALNPKWYMPKEGKTLPINDSEVKKGFMKFLKKVYTSEEAAILRKQFMQFSRLKGPRFSTPECREDRATIAQSDPIGWWDLYGDDAPELRQLAVRLLSQVGSSSAAERNWSTYGFIHSMRRNRLTPKRAEKLVAVHSYLRLRERVKPEYRASPLSRWDIDPVEAASQEVDDDAQGLIGLPLDMEGIQLDDEGSSSDDHDMDDEDADSDYNQNILGAHEPVEPED